MKAAELRKSILQAAVQGKLVPQDIHDEPASVLLERIRDEKARLVKEGKIKKEKPLLPIIEDEIPYDLPEGWVWCRLGDIIIQNIGGGTPSKQNLAYWNGNIPWASVKDLTGSILDKTQDCITELGLKESSSNLIPANSIIVCTRMGLGKIAINTIPVAINQDLRALIISRMNIDLRYIIAYYKTLSIRGEGTTVKGISIEELHNMLFPLPPLAEQQRIVAKVNELMSLCDELEEAEQELDALESRFEEYLPKSILQAAVQGKLVPQDLHDEPASVLLERIRAEKVRLVKEGKIKKEKPLPPISEDETPYDLPEGWVWCRLGDIIIQNIGGGTPSKQNLAYWNGNIPWASVKDLTGPILDKTRDCITELGLEESSSNLIPANSIIVCTRMGLGKIAINTIPVAINQDLRALIISRMNIDLRYIIAYYKTLSIRGEGTTVKGISIEELHNMLFPLPPLAEQQRIVDKVEELMALCEKIKAVKTKPIEQRDTNKVLDFPAVKQDGQLQLAARGEISKKSSNELMQAIDEMFAGDE